MFTVSHHKKKTRRCSSFYINVYLYEDDDDLQTHQCLKPNILYYVMCQINQINKKHLRCQHTNQLKVIEHIKLIFVQS